MKDGELIIDNFVKPLADAFKMLLSIEAEEDRMKEDGEAK